MKMGGYKQWSEGKKEQVPDVASWIWKGLLPYKRSIIGGILMLAVHQAGQLSVPLVWKYIVDHAVIPMKTGPLWEGLAILLGLGVLTTLSAVFRSFWIEKAGLVYIKDLRNRLHAKYLGQSLAYFHNRRLGDLLSRSMSDVDALQRVLIQGSDSILGELLSMFGALAILIYLYPPLGLSMLIPMAAILAATFWYNQRSKPFYLSTREKLGDLSSSLQENLSGMQVIKAFAQEGKAQDRFENKTKLFFLASLRSIWLRMRYQPVISSSNFTGNMLMIGLGAWFCIRGDMTLGTLIAFRGYWHQLFGPIHRLTSINDLFQQAMASGSRVKSVLDAPPEVEDWPAARSPEAVRGGVNFRNVTFAYGARTVLDGINLEIRPGQKFALIGPSGAGKTTLFSLIPRFMDPQAGSVEIDGDDVRGFYQTELRRHIAIVPQDTYLFNATIAENIRLGRPKADDAEVMEAARLANAHEFILDTEKGYQSMVGERGVKLSGGQRQRLAIARAFLADPAILILDEATSSVEPESEKLIWDALDRLMVNRTCIISTHRLSMVRRADRIAVLEGGRITALGTHSELATESGFYAEMLEIQLGGEWYGVLRKSMAQEAG